MVFKRLLELWQDKKKYEGTERRKYIRLVYPLMTRPRLKIRKHEFEVINISQEGLKFRNYKQIKLGEIIYGTVTLLTGKSLRITGKIMWECGDEVGLLATRISQSVLIEEIQTLLQEKDSNKSIGKS